MQGGKVVALLRLDPRGPKPAWWTSQTENKVCSEAPNEAVLQLRRPAQTQYQFPGPTNRGTTTIVCRMHSLTHDNVKTTKGKNFVWSAVTYRNIPKARIGVIESA